MPKTWIGPYFAAYASAYNLPPTPLTVGKMVRSIRKLEEMYGPETTLNHFRRYLAVTAHRYFSAPRFAERFLSYGVAVTRTGFSGGVPDQQPGETVDAYIERLARLDF